MDDPSPWAVAAAVEEEGEGEEEEGRGWDLEDGEEGGGPLFTRLALAANKTLDQQQSTSMQLPSMQLPSLVTSTRDPSSAFVT